LRAFPDQKVELWDERFTTTIAERIMIEGNVSREKRRHSRDKSRGDYLQGYLDNRGGCRRMNRRGFPDGVKTTPMLEQYSRWKNEYPIAAVLPDGGFYEMFSPTGEASRIWILR
jgi:hypothetical protein